MITVINSICRWHLHFQSGVLLWNSLTSRLWYIYWCGTWLSFLSIPGHPCPLKPCMTSSWISYTFYNKNLSAAFWLLTIQKFSNQFCTCKGKGKLSPLQVTKERRLFALRSRQVPSHWSMCCQPRCTIISGSRGKQNNFNAFDLCPAGFLISYPFISSFFQNRTYVCYYCIIIMSFLTVVKCHQCTYRKVVYLLLLVLIFHPWQIPFHI